MLNKAIDLLVYWDHVVWYYMNTQWHNAFFDTVIPFLRNQWFWAPVYLFLAIFIPAKFGKQGVLWCLFFLISFIISDQMSSTLLKPFFHRLRPCHNPYLTSVIHLLIPCGGMYGFPSTHAANHFSIGIFSAVTLSRYAKWVWPVAVFWAMLVSFAQVYVGVHFPLDVAFGAVIGTTAGIITGKFFNRYITLVRPTSATIPKG
jgi:membrane-associated phospholipid phosphatase